MERSGYERVNGVVALLVFCLGEIEFKCEMSRSYDQEKGSNIITVMTGTEAN